MSVVLYLSRDPTLSLPPLPLAWALSIGAGVSGNSTIVGNAPNIVALNISERAGYPISFRTFSFYGVPLVVINLLVASAWLMLLYA
jgi:Na+/H+ antiporter NhaD/arsenite permease-like protein